MNEPWPAEPELETPKEPPILAETPAVAGPKPFSRRATGIFLCLAIGVFLARNWPYLTENRVAFFAYPATTAFWSLHYGMQIEEALQRLSPQQRFVMGTLGMPSEGMRENCELMLRDVLNHLERSGGNASDKLKVRAHLAVLLAEAGSLTNAHSEVARLGTGPEAEQFREIFHTAYGIDDKPAPLNHSGEAETELTTGWAHWRLSQRWLKATGKDREAQAEEKSIVAAEDKMLGRLAWVQGFAGLIQLAGLGCLVCLLVWRPAFQPDDWGFKNLPWPAVESWGLFFRATFYGIVLERVACYLPWVGYYGWIAHCLLFATPGVILLVSRHWARDWSTFQRFFGVPTREADFFRLLLAGLGTFSICWLVLVWIPLLTEALGCQGNWADGVDEVLLTWPWSYRIVHLADGIIFGPIIEEIVYRGLLFGALRARLPAVPAALVSTAVFSFAHFYSLPGFLGVAAFGFVCALAREKTGSLLPCIFAHCLTNLLLFGGEVWVMAE